ncbi:TrgA family protein [Dinoroseobacter sp. S76]|uniref:TrgA family protein n=1 Tax=Dinoroseobacter sp. S76 TaxID=3415124 RepID=UPI00316992AB
MPTGAKLIGAIIFGLTGALAAWIGIPGLPDGRQAGALLPLATLSGIWFGWRMAGTQVGGTLRQALTLSVRTVSMMLAATLFLIAGEEAYQRSIKLRYDGPIEAVTDVANLMLYFGQMAIQGPVLTVLALGIVTGAVFVRWAGYTFE